MAFEISPTLTSLKDQINKEPMLVLEIEGSQYLYGSAPILETARWDDSRINWDNQIGVTWDGEIEKANSKPYIIVKGKTTKQLSQQLLVDKGGSGSVATMNIELVDYRGEVAQDLSFGQIGDPLGKKATIYMGLAGGRFPQDFFRLLIGYVDDLQYEAGSITVSVAQAQNLMRQSAFEQYQAQLIDPINTVDTVLNVVETATLLESQDALTSYIRIDDEVMEVVSKTDTTITVIRGSIGTAISSHDADADILSQYGLTGRPLDLALKLMHSRLDNGFSLFSSKIVSLNRISSTEIINGAIIVDSYDIQESSGASAGDLIELIGTASNDGIYTIIGFDRLDTGRSVILVDSNLSEETSLSLDLNLKSQYNVLPDGAGLDLNFVDTPAFEEIASIFQASFTDYTFYLKDTIENVRDFIISEIFTPQGLYLIPRKGKASCKYTAPPFSVEDLPILNTSNLVDLTKITMRRSTHKYLLNSVIYRYNQGIIEDKFFDKVVRLSADSFNRIKTGRKRLEINSLGLRRNNEVAQLIDRASRGILNRYRFGARYVRNIKPLFQVGLILEIGDIVFFGGEDTQLVNFENGERNIPIGQYEIINKKLNSFTGSTSVELLETGFDLDGIFGVFSPASRIAAGSDQNRLLVEEFWESDQYEKERDKWDKWIGLKVRVRSDDYTFDELATLQGLDSVTNNGLLITGLSTTPPVGSFVELAKYQDYGQEELELLAKLTYTFVMAQAEIDTVTDDKIFDVLDSSELSIGMTINVHSDDYTEDSETRVIDDIVGNTITLDEDLNITPAAGYKVEIYSFPDARGYRFL